TEILGIIPRFIPIDAAIQEALLRTKVRQKLDEPADALLGFVGPSGACGRDIALQRPAREFLLVRFNVPAGRIPELMNARLTPSHIKVTLPLQHELANLAVEQPAIHVRVDQANGKQYNRLVGNFNLDRGAGLGLGRLRLLLGCSYPSAGHTIRTTRPK